VIPSGQILVKGLPTQQREETAEGAGTVDPLPEEEGLGWGTLFPLEGEGRGDGLGSGSLISLEGEGMVDPKGFGMFSGSGEGDCC
jgi:hypothetical protein